MEEHCMLVPPPSTGQGQRISHVLVQTFRDVYAKEQVSSETIRHLNVSKPSSGGYHDQYVERLKKIEDNCTEQLKETDKLLQQISGALKTSRKLESEENQSEKDKYKGYQKLGLQPAASKLGTFLDSKVLSNNKLISTADIFNDEDNFQNAPTAKESDPQYTSSTFSSRQLFDAQPANDLYSPPAKSALRNSLQKRNSKMQNVTKPASEKPIWRDCINPKQREYDKQDLLALQNKTNFLKNPRFSYTSSKGPNDSNKQLLKASPCPVVFQDYQPDKTYEIKLELKNITSSCRQVRVMQPSTSYFKVGPGEFPSTDGLVAPGMSCKFTVFFKPLSLADYQDSFTVKCQCMDEMTIPLLAIRQKPILSLDELIDCGNTLVNSVKQKHLQVVNSGGPARFVFNQTQLDQIEWKNLDYDGNRQLNLNMFTIQPKCFQLNTGEATVLKVTFAPTSVKRFSEELVLHVDNCTHVLYAITGTSEIASIQLESVEGGVRGACIDETVDPTAQQVVEFQCQHPNVAETKTIAIKNQCSVALDFDWKISIPCLSLHNEETVEANEEFQIEPNKGSLKPNDTSTFQLTFLPKRTGRFYNVASLHLNDIPNSNGIVETTSPLKLSLKAFSKGYSINIEPLFINFDGENFIDIPYTKPFKIKNTSKSMTSFEWHDYISDDVVASVTPKEGQIGAEDSVQCLVTMEGRQPNKCCEVKLLCDVPYSSLNNQLFLHATFSGVKTEFLERNVHFGVMKIGTSKVDCVTLQNQSPVSALWSLSLKPGDEHLPFSFYPCEGELAAQSTQKIAVHFSPQHFAVTIDTYLQCSVFRGDDCYLPIVGEVQRPHVITTNTRIEVSQAFVGTPVQVKFNVQNKTTLTTNCTWSFVERESVNSMEFSPQCHTIGPHESVDVTAQVVFYQVGLTDVLVACDVGDMINPIVWKVFADVKGLSVEVLLLHPTISDTFCECLDFGINNQLGEVQTRSVILKNNSAISTTYSLRAQYFTSARVPTPPTGRSPAKRRPLLSKTANIANPSSKSEDAMKKDCAAEILRSGRGMAILCTPDYGHLQAFEEKIITVSVFTDMWGEYNDNIVCKIGEVEQLIPVNIDVVGFPLSFQMTIGQTSIVRFGSHISGGDAVTRKLRLNNTSQCTDIRLDWQTFVLAPQDSRLIDLNMFVGRPFPPNDADDDLCDIRLHLTEHHGVQSNQPFNFIQSQKVIPAKGHAQFELEFRPPANVKQEKNFIGYALGYMSLHKKDLETAGYVKRFDGLDMLPFSFNITATVKSSKLILSPCDDDDGNTFNLSFNQLKNQESIQSSHRFLLLNTSDVTVQFQCSTQSPFSYKLEENAKRSGDKIVVKANKNIKVSLSFELTREFAVKMHSNNTTEVDGAFKINFDDKNFQDYPLKGLVEFPRLCISQSHLAFNTCYVTESRGLTFTISNPCKQNIHWRIYKEHNTPSACKEVFEIENESGEIAGHTRNSSKNFTDINVKFTPKHNVSYECRLFVVSVVGERLLNETPTVVTLSGTGSYDQTFIKEW